MDCIKVSSESLKEKGIAGVIDCRANKTINIPGISGINAIVREASSIIGLKNRIVFMDNEPIGGDYIVYRYRSYYKGDSYISIRVVRRENRVFRLLFVVPVKLRRLLDDFEAGRSIRDLNIGVKRNMYNGAPGQKYIPDFIIYRILGQPVVDLSNYRLRVDGLVEKVLEYGINDLYRLLMKNIRRDFHCVTGWSIRGVEWKGIPLEFFYREARVSGRAKWVYFTGLDGYTSIVPLEDYLAEEGILALFMNREKISPDHGFPARIVIPHLYGWKGVKWVHRITFIEEYRDGYWEALGYHPRGNVWLEERFKTG